MIKFIKSDNLLNDYRKIMYSRPEELTEEIIKYFIDNFDNTLLHTYYSRTKDSEIIDEFDVPLTFIKLIVDIFRNYLKLVSFEQLESLRYKLVSRAVDEYFSKFGYNEKNIETLWRLKYTRPNYLSVDKVQHAYNIINYYYNLDEFERYERDSFLAKLEEDKKIIDIFDSCLEYQHKKFMKTIRNI